MSCYKIQSSYKQYVDLGVESSKGKAFALFFCYGVDNRSTARMVGTTLSTK